MITNKFDILIRESSDRWSVPFDWIKAIIGTESDFDPNAYRAEPHINDASYGLMQILEQTARSLGFTEPVIRLYDPAINIDLGTKYLRQLILGTGMHFESVYSAYNSGSPTKYLESKQVQTNVERALRWLSIIKSQTQTVLPLLIGFFFSFGF